MTDARILTNANFAWFIGPASSITDWKKPTLTALSSLINVTDAVRLDGTDFNVQASQMQDNRSFGDAAGAQERGFTQFGGNLEGFTPGANGGIFATLRDILKTPRVELAVVQRPGISKTAPLAEGDVINLYHVIVDAPAHHRSDTGYSYGVELVARDDVLINYVIPKSSPSSVTISPSGTLSLEPGDIDFIKATYEGVNITIGATYVSSDESVVQVTKGGVLIADEEGTATITVTYPGGGAATELAVTVESA